MRMLLPIALAVVGTLLAGCGRHDLQTELRWRFVGGGLLSAQTNAPVLADVLRLPEAAAVAGPLATNLAQVWWHLGGGTNELRPELAEAGSTLMRGLMERLSIGEVVAAPGGGREFALAIQGLGNQAAAWEKAWPVWIKALHSARGSGGEPLVVQKDVWLLAVSDAALLPPDATFRRLATYPPEAALLQFDAQFAGQPAIKGVVTASNGAVRLNTRLTTARDLPSALPAWEIPRAIHEPLVLFTALRGLPELAASLPVIGEWTGRPAPAQMFAWGQPGKSVHTYFAARVDDPRAAIEQLRDRLRPSFDAAPTPRFRGELSYDPKGPRLVMAGAIPMVPAFEPLDDAGRKFVTFGVFPAARATNALSPEMLAQLNRPNVLLYDWEITAEAVHHWHVLGQLYDMQAGRHAVLNTPATQWLLAAAPKMGEAVTEGLTTGPRELTLHRKSSVGLTGVELAAFAKWLDPSPPYRPEHTNSPARPKAH
jgi:hypothetical protein